MVQFIDAIENDTETPLGVEDGLNQYLWDLQQKKSVEEGRPVKISEINSNLKESVYGKTYNEVEDNQMRALSWKTRVSYGLMIQRVTLYGMIGSLLTIFLY